MIKELVLLAAFCIASSIAFPADKTPEKIVAIVPVDREEMKAAETFYSGYSASYPSYGVNTHSGWRGDHQNGYGVGYGAGYGAGYGPGFGPAGYGPGYGGGGYIGTYGSVGGIGAGVGGGYGWKNGPNRWAI